MSAVLDDLDVEPEKLEAFVREERYEIIDGEFVELPPMSADSQVLASRIVRHLSNFGIDRDMGEAFTEVLIKLPLPVDRNRRSDAIFVPYDRWPKLKPIPRTNAWEVLPSICIEVVSPHDLAEEMLVKIQEYFDSGVQQVWVVFPRHAQLYVYSSPTSISLLTRTDVLDGGKILPGFQLPLSELFPNLKGETGSGLTG